MAHEKGTIYFDESEGWQVVCANCRWVFSPTWSRLSGDDRPYLTQGNPPASRSAMCPLCWQIHVQEIPANPVMLKSAVMGDGK